MSGVGSGAKGGWHLVEWSCELVGTALLVFLGLSAVVFDFGAGSPLARVLPSVSWRLLVTGTLFAASGALVTVSPLGRRSGAHLNPAVTAAFWLERHLHRHDLAGYLAGQVAGALAGAGLLRVVWGARAASVDYGRTLPGPGVGPAEAVVIEAAMTAALVLVIFSFVSSPRTARWTPWAALVLVAVEVWRGAPYTGTSLNPARSLGPAVVAGVAGQLWIYFAGPLAGAVLAVGTWKAVPRVTLTAKLFHDPRYPSVFRSVLPVRPWGIPHPGPVPAGPAEADGAAAGADGERLGEYSPARHPAT